MKEKEKIQALRFETNWERKTRRRSFSSTVPKYARFLTGACFVFGFVLYREARVYRMQRREMADEGFFMDRRSMVEGDYAYYGAPYGYEEIYQAAYPIGAIAKNGRVPFYPDAYQGAYQVAANQQFLDQAKMILPPKDEMPMASSSQAPMQNILGNVTMGSVSNPALGMDPMTEWKPPNISYPEISDLKVDDFTKKSLFDFYKIGPNRRRQQNHGSEVPKKRYPQLIIVGAKKCGTTALKIFMNYHPGLRDTPGERHFFNRPTNWKLGFKWYLDQMPLSYNDEVTYEKTPDYFDRPFVPERMAQMNDSVKIISILCDPVHRAYSHFLHAFAVQKTADNGNAMPGWYWLEGHTEFSEVVRIAMKRILQGALPNEISPEEIRSRVAQYYSKWDAPANERVYPLRIPDVILTGGLYPVHINQYTQFLKQENMLFLDASELMDNPGKVMREVAQFVGLPPAITEDNFYFDESKGFYCMKPPPESERGPFCLAGDKGRSKNAQVDDGTKKLIRQFYAPFLEELSQKYTHAQYDHWDW